MPRDTRSRGYVWTWNNYPVDHCTILSAIQCRYIVFGRELAPETGTPHLQGYVYFAHGKTASSVRSLLRGCHVEASRGLPSQIRTYCIKDGDFEERGSIPGDPVDRGDAECTRWQSAWDAAKIGDIEAIPPDIRIRSYSAIRRIERDFMPPVENLGAPCGIWIFGLAGVGKTLAVVTKYPNVFIKPRNVWWDGYQREPVVLLDDVDKFDVRLGGFLKHWADAYAFIGESKGGSVRIRPKQLLVTSQYRIEEIWEDVETRAALMRRFREVEKTLGNEITNLI